MLKIVKNKYIGVPEMRWFSGFAGYFRYSNNEWKLYVNSCGTIHIYPIVKATLID